MAPRKLPPTARRMVPIPNSTSSRTASRPRRNSSPVIHTRHVPFRFRQKLDREIKRATNNTIDLKIVFAVGIIGLTVFEVGATAATPVWVTLAIFTVNHFIEMHERQPNGNAGLAPATAPVRVAG